MENKETGTLIGTIDFVSWKPKQQIAWGKGIVNEVAKEVLTYGFMEMNLISIQAKCLVENIGSARVMEKVGMFLKG
ncbi:GNAT family N-acetyltransferase [Viridibacillus sp. NPDC096237]|uniref:GNAT family N-acetyltransferase n=1 Tax=Viridibacillus sp. NPDC096237 TaxID=3390721 RepID=UPI003D04947C